MKKLVSALLAASALALAAVNMADARELRAAPAAPPPHPANGVMYVNFAKYLPEESDGRLTATILGPEVVGLTQMKDALQSQIAEVGNLLPLYFPADLPMMSVTGQLSLTGTNSQAMGAALTEFVVNCEPCQQEMKDLGFIYLGSGASDVYEFLTVEPVRTAEDLKGLRLRSGGAPWARFAEHFGATPVQMPAGEIYNSLQTGLIDGVVTGTSAVGDFKLDEVANSYTFGAPLGRISFYLVMNKAKYDSLSDEFQQAIDDNSGRMLSKSAEDGWNARAEQVKQSLIDAGDNNVIDLSEEEVAAFGAITEPVAEKIVGEAGNEDVLSVMSGM